MMNMTAEQERVKNLLVDTVSLLCKNGLMYRHDLRIEGLLGITVDNKEVFIVHLNERFREDGTPIPMQPDTTNGHNESNAGGRGRKRRAPSPSGGPYSQSQRHHFNRGSRAGHAPNDNEIDFQHTDIKQEPPFSLSPDSKASRTCSPTPVPATLNPTESPEVRRMAECKVVLDAAESAREAVEQARLAQDTKVKREPGIPDEVNADHRGDLGGDNVENNEVVNVILVTPSVSCSEGLVEDQAYVDNNNKGEENIEARMENQSPHRTIRAHNAVMAEPTSDVGVNEGMEGNRSEEKLQESVSCNNVLSNQTITVRKRGRPRKNPDAPVRKQNPAKLIPKKRVERDNDPSKEKAVKQPKIKSKKDLLLCQHCGFTAKFKSRIRDHIERCHKNIIYQCPHCELTYKDKHRLKDHVDLKHLGAKVKICDVCGKTGFSSSQTFVEHIRTCKGLFTFRCAFCNKGFLRRKNLRDHMNSHTGNKEFMCVHCGRAYTQKGQLNKHIKSCSRVPSEPTAEQVENPETSAAVTAILEPTYIQDGMEGTTTIDLHQLPLLQYAVDVGDGRTYIDHNGVTYIAQETITVCDTV